MTDREMLELIAKAMGVQIDWDARGAYIITPGISGNCDVWNPRDNDGDCFRMETELGIDVMWSSVDVMSEHLGDYHEERYDAHNGDKGAARRLASCLVAMQIGREME